MVFLRSSIKERKLRRLLGEFYEVILRKGNFVDCLGTFMSSVGEPKKFMNQVEEISKMLGR